MLVMLLESSNDLETDRCCAGAISLWWCQRRRQDCRYGSQSRSHPCGSVSPTGRVPGAGNRVQRRSPRPRSVHRDIPPVSGKRGDRHHGYRPPYCRGSGQEIEHLLCGLFFCLWRSINICDTAFAVARTAHRNNIKRPGVIPVVVLLCRHSTIDTLDRPIKTFQFPAAHSTGYLLMCPRSNRCCAVCATAATKRASVPGRQQTAERTGLHLRNLTVSRLRCAKRSARGQFSLILPAFWNLSVFKPFSNSRLRTPESTGNFRLRSEEIK